MDFNPAKKEVNASERCLKRMLEAKNYDDFEQEWRDFLNHLEKIYEKLQRACSTKPAQFNNLILNENLQRSTDQLLIYLKQARNADTHTLQNIAERVDPTWSVRVDSTPGETTFIKSLQVRGGIVEQYEGSHPLIITFSPETVRVLSVINRGQTYLTPTNHLGKAISSTHPYDLAKLGLDFYTKLFEKVSSHDF